MSVWYHWKAHRFYLIVFVLNILLEVAIWLVTMDTHSLATYSFK